jgi:hypothetical protein
VVRPERGRERLAYSRRQLERGPVLPDAHLDLSGRLLSRYGIESADPLGEHWTGNGKWLLRELRDLDAGLADRWLAAHGDTTAIASFAGEILDRACGPLFAGYRVTGE